MKMLFSKNIVSTLKSPTVVNGILRRTIVSTPPRNRISVAEKLAHGFVMVAGILATPLYISTNFKNYQGDTSED